MNEKQGEHLDHRIRQALGSLPDAPPPGSPFDSARLWEQLRPELAAPPASRKRVGAWWWAAASVVVLVMGGWFYVVSVWPVAKQVSVSHPRSVGTQTAVSGLISERPARTPGHAWQADDAEPVQRIGPSHGGATLGRQAKKSIPTWPDGPTDYQSVVQPIPPQPVIPESVTVIAEIPTSTIATAPKRRFRVVHENELMAEDEAHRIRYAPEGRTERFVRIGTGSSAQPTVSEESPALMLPLNRKTTQ
jgi:hypothetical protein